MPSERHSWKDGNIPVLGKHSEAKHQLLGLYIQEYLRILCSPRQVRKFNITLIDGFAGGGMYADGKIGSPFVMIESSQKAIHDINKDKSNAIEINPAYYFIEQDRDNFQALEKSMTGNVHLSNICLINDNFTNQVDNVIRMCATRHPRGGGGIIFFLDQEGYSGVSMEVLQKIRTNLPQAEIIFTFAISWWVDLMRDRDRLSKTINTLNLRNLNIDEIKYMANNVKDNRNLIEARIAQSIQKSSYFPFFRPFFIEPEKNHKGYWLLHLSPHHRAHDAMTDVIWGIGNCMRHYGGAGNQTYDIFYKANVVELPNIFGETFNQSAWKDHKEGLDEYIPRRIWEYPGISVDELMRNSCNETAANRKMYAQSLSTLAEEGELTIKGPSGGKKRGGEIMPSDRVEPNKQMTLFMRTLKDLKSSK